MFTVIVMTALIVWAFKNIAEVLKLSELLDRKHNGDD